jgi:hypothetical protein
VTAEAAAPEALAEAAAASVVAVAALVAAEDWEAAEAVSEDAAAI